MLHHTRRLNMVALVLVILEFLPTSTPHPNPYSTPSQHTDVRNTDVDGQPTYKCRIVKHLQFGMRNACTLLTCICNAIIYVYSSHTLPHDPITVYQTGNSRYKSPLEGGASLIHTNLSNGYELFHQGKIKWDSCDSYFGNVFGGYCGERSDGPKLLSGGLFGKKGGALAMYGVTPYPS